MSSIAIPDKASLTKLLGDLLGAELKLNPLPKPAKASSGDPVAVYRTDDGSLAGACSASLSAAARMGAMIAMIPIAAVEEAEKQGALPEHMAENYREVMNICAQILSSGSAPHVRLDTLYTDRSGLPEDVQKMLGAPSARADFSVATDGESPGEISFLAA